MSEMSVRTEPGDVSVLTCRETITVFKSVGRGGGGDFGGH